MKHPCLECPNAKLSKNCKECVECEKKIKYLISIYEPIYTNQVYDQFTEHPISYI
jgi:hypothetical protein